MSLIRMDDMHKLIRGEVKKFAAAELEPHAADIETDCKIPSEIVRKVSEMGLFGLTIPESSGGSGLDMTSLCLALEELSRSCASLAMMVAVTNCLVVYPLSKFGTADMKDRYFKKILNGTIGGYAPFPDIELSDRECLLESVNDRTYVTNRYDIVLNGAVADFFIVPVKFEKGVALLLLENNTEGMNNRPVRIMGLHSAAITGLDLKHKELTKDTVIVPAERGYQAIESTLDHARIGFSSVALGLSQASLDASIKYAKQRRQFGRAIAEFPMIQEMIAEMKITVEKSRLLVYEAAHRYESGEEYGMAAKMACLTSCKGAVRIASDTIQVHGGYGYTKDYPVERFFRDAKTVQILGGSSVNLKTDIAKEILL
jgi:alkylation response protein AidB-like acyl-CoA dehydrogenase